jgi:hypothetical protein
VEAAPGKDAGSAALFQPPGRIFGSAGSTASSRTGVPTRFGRMKTRESDWSPPVQVLSKVWQSGMRSSRSTSNAPTIASSTADGSVGTSFFGRMKLPVAMLLKRSMTSSPGKACWPVTSS